MSDPIKVDFSDTGKGKGTSSTKEVLIPPEKAGLKIVLSLIITAVVGAIIYYFMLPPMNFSAVEFYIFWAVVLAVFIACNFLLSKAFIKPEYVPYVKRVSIAPIVIAIILVVVLLVGYLTSAVFFRASSYTQLLALNDDVEFSQSVTKIDSTSDFSNVAMIDTDAASKLADKVLGELATRNLESQFDIATEYSTQINFNGSPCRVYPLKYGNVFKWLNNTGDGFPGYVIVNMNTQETEFYFLTDADTTDGYMKYSPTEHFQKNLKRIVRFNYPTALIGTISFEIDDDNTPYWICEILEKKIGLIGGDDVKGIVLVNAVTGEMSYHSSEEVAAENSELTWIDQVYDATLLVEQYNYYGTYINGFWNSLFGQTGVKKTTTGSSYIAMDDDVYIYTGVTSVTSDESILGFILINQRTKEANFYNISGATESSAQSSAQGALSDKGWTATFPLLINLDGEPTYFMAMKDSNSVVKSYAMVNVSNYNIVGTDSADGNPSLTTCINNYAKALKDSKNTVINVDTSVEPEIVTDDSVDSEDVVDITVTGMITGIKSQIEDGTTCYYLLTNADNLYFKVSASDYPEAIFLSVGDTITVTYSESDSLDSWTEITSLTFGETQTEDETA